MALKRGDRSYNADTNEWEVKKKKDAPKATKVAEAKPSKSKAKAKAKAPVPKDRPKKSKAPVKVRVPSQAVADQAAKGTKLKGKVADLPSKKKSGITKGGNTGNKSKKGANQIATYIKRRVR